MDKFVSSQRARFAPYVEQLSGTEMREDFRGAFENAAGRYALGRMDGTEFRAVVGELIRDASGTAYRQDRAAARAAEHGSPFPDPDGTPWATMPVDGSGRMGRAERAVVFLTGVASVIVLVWLGFLASGVFGTSPDAPAVNLPAATVADARDVNTDMITRGAYWSWEAATECARGDRSCDAALARINGEAAPYGLHVWEDGSVSPLGN